MQKKYYHILRHKDICETIEDSKKVVFLHDDCRQKTIGFYYAVCNIDVDTDAKWS